MDEQQVSLCFKCKNFIRFYTKRRNKFHPIDRGFCKEFGIRSENRCCKITECHLWEPLASPKEEREILEKELKNISKRLNEIADFLTNA